MRFQTIFCEDIRMEIGGTATLIGAFPGVIFVSPEVGKVDVAQWIQIDGLDEGKHELAISAYFVADDEERLGAIDFDVDVFDRDSAMIVTPTGLELRAIRDGKLVIRVGVDGGDPVLAGEIRVEKVSIEDRDSEDDQVE